ncbi:hypothetical protein ZHAS_00013986 [Anopheles sinensis]|uniref:Uncharacterized protein n=1 Tax=Anopheles sinensis TaxID=74873 RepID=A0A084W6X9_ANOSI|nr:hypothetical protein ZHAS_00013986 [Anopheles sinensis]
MPVRALQITGTLKPQSLKLTPGRSSSERGFYAILAACSNDNDYGARVPQLHSNTTHFLTISAGDGGSTEPPSLRTESQVLVSVSVANGKIIINEYYCYDRSDSNVDRYGFSRCQTSGGTRERERSWHRKTDTSYCFRERDQNDTATLRRFALSNPIAISGVFSGFDGFAKHAEMQRAELTTGIALMLHHRIDPFGMAVG